MSEKRLLVEYHDIKFQLNEDKATGELNIEGEFGKADVPTANGRIYPRHIWEREIARIKKDMSEGKVFGHLNHPKDGKTDLKEVALVMKDIWLEDDGRVMGKATVVENTHGAQYRAIRKAGGKVGVSSRGMGSTKMGEGKYSGSEVVDDDYEYMTHDLVADPAVRTSYPDVVSENKVNEDVIPQGEVVTKTNIVENEIPPAKENETSKTYNFIVDGCHVHAQVSDGRHIWMLISDDEKKPVYGKAWEHTTVASRDDVKDMDSFKAYAEKEAKEVIEYKKLGKQKHEDSMNAKTQIKEDEIPAQVDAAATEKAAEIVTQKINDMEATSVPATEAPVELPSEPTTDTVSNEPSVELEEAKKQLTAKDEEITSLKAQLESKTKEFDTLVIESKKITESAKRFGIALAYEKEINACKLQEDRKRLQQMVGKPTDFNSMESLIESVTKAKKSLSEEKLQKAAEQKKIDEAVSKLQNENKLLKEDNEKKTRAIEESLVKQNQLAAKKYLEEQVKHNPNAEKIRIICEGISDKKKIDEVIKQFSVATAQFESYDLIQRRIKIMEDAAKAKSTLVEDQIAKTKPTVQESKTGLEAELADAGAI